MNTPCSGLSSLGYGRDIDQLTGAVSSIPAPGTFVLWFKLILKVTSQLAGVGRRCFIIDMHCTYTRKSSWPDMDDAAKHSPTAQMRMIVNSTLQASRGQVSSGSC